MTDYLQQDYFPSLWSGCKPIHEVRDWCKVRKLIRDARKGIKIKPILIDGDIGNGNLLTGTHRSAANDIMMMLGEEDSLISFITLDDVKVTKKLKKAIEEDDFETINEMFDK